MGQKRGIRNTGAMIRSSRKTISPLFFILTLLIAVVTGFVYQQGSQYITQTIKDTPYFFVDNDLSNLDFSPDKGKHSNFTAQQYGPDSIFDTLIEKKTGEIIEDYVDNDTSDMDYLADKGTHSNFEDQKARDSTYDTLTEVDTSFGAYWFYNDSDTEQSFTNTAYGEKHTLEFNAPAQGDYLIIVSFTITSSSTTYSVCFRAQLDDTTTIMEGLTEPTDTGKDNEYRSQESLYLAESLTNGSHCVDIDAYSEDAATTCYIRYMHIVVLRLDDWLSTAGMYVYSSNDMVLSLPGFEGSWTEAQSIEITPDQSGDYLILASLELYSGYTFDSISARINFDNGNEYIPLENTEEFGENYVTYEAQDTTDWRCWVWGGIVNISTTKTVKLEACRTGGSDANAAVRRRRLIAMRLAAMDSNAQSTEDTSVTSTTGQWIDKSTLTFTPSSQRDYLIFSGMVIKPDSTLYPSHCRLEHTAGTNTGTIGQLNVYSKDSSNPADCIPFFTVKIKELGAASQTFKTQYGRTGIFGTTYGKGSFIVAIRKPAGVQANYELDLEIQFTDVIDFLENETLCIYAGNLGSEDIGVGYWTGSYWSNLTTDLTANSWNNYTVSLNSSTFTIRFKGGAEKSDIILDQWQIDASLLRVEGAGSKEDAVDNDTSDEDYSSDLGTLSNFDNMKTKDGMATLTEEDTGGNGNWGITSSGFSSTSIHATYRYMGGTSPNIQDMIVTKLWIRCGASGTLAIALYTGGSLTDPTGATKRTEAYNVTVSPGWNEVDVPDYSWPANTVTWIGWCHSASIYYSSSSSDSGDFQSERGRWDQASPTDADETSSMPNSPGSGSFSDFWYAVYAEYTAPSNYQLDQEVQWTNITYQLPNEELCIYCGTMGSEDIKVEAWNGDDWETIFNDLSPGWNNQSIIDWLTSTNFTIRFKGGTETGDTNQGTWDIDVALIHIWNEAGENYELDLEVQWTNVDYDEVNEYLCIYGGTMGAENITVDAWNGTAWKPLFNYLSGGWNNVTVSTYLNSSTFTIRFKGGIETSDITKDSWKIDVSLLHVWT